MLNTFSLLKKYTYLYIGLFVFLLFFPDPFESYLHFSPNTSSKLYDFIEGLWDPIVLWCGKVFFNVEITIKPNGSGDTTWNFVQLFVISILTLFIVLVVFFIKRSKINNNTWRLYFLVFTRYTLATFMISYGWSKVFYLQFSEPLFFMLNKNFGDMHPMSLLWSFMGYSKGYTIFTGMVEVLAGLLLFTKRTTTLGAIIALVAMVQVVALNFFYSVPVKLLSSSLTFLSLIIIYDDRTRLINLFFKNKPTVSRQAVHLYKTKNQKVLKLLLKGLFIFNVVGFGVYNSYQNQKEYGSKVPKPPLYGYYQVEKFTINNKELPPLTTDSTRWKNIIIDKYYSRIRTMNNSSIYFKIKTDSLLKTFDIENSNDSTQVGNFRIDHLDSTSMKVEGIWIKDTLKIDLKKKRRQDYKLLKQEFKWIIEYPRE